MKIPRGLDDCIVMVIPETKDQGRAEDPYREKVVEARRNLGFLFTIVFPHSGMANRPMIIFLSFYEIKFFCQNE